MKFFEDGKSAKGGSDQDDKEDFCEASRRSNGGPRKKDQRTVLDNFWLCRRQDRDSQKRYQTVLGKGQPEEQIEENALCSQELGLVLSFSAASGKSSQASAADELQEREAMRDWSETVEVL